MVFMARQASPLLATSPARAGVRPAGLMLHGGFCSFGGFGYDSVSRTPGLLNDLWNYNITTGQWTWVSGSNTVNQSGNYGTKGTTAGANVPGARETSMSWIDLSGNFWLFGGFDLDSVGSPAALNDLWAFNEGQWTWMSGANV